MAKKAKTVKNKLPVSSTPVPVTIEPAKAEKGDKDREMKYRAEDALRDIERAEKHKGDKELMGHVKTLAKEKVSSLKKIC